MFYNFFLLKSISDVIPNLDYVEIVVYLISSCQDTLMYISCDRLIFTVELHAQSSCLLGVDVVYLL